MLYNSHMLAGITRLCACQVISIWHYKLHFSIIWQLIEFFEFKSKSESELGNWHVECIGKNYSSLLACKRNECYSNPKCQSNSNGDCMMISKRVALAQTAIVSIIFSIQLSVAQWVNAESQAKLDKLNNWQLILNVEKARVSQLCKRVIRLGAAKAAGPPSDSCKADSTFWSAQLKRLISQKKKSSFSLNWFAFPFTYTHTHTHSAHSHLVQLCRAANFPWQ